MYIVHMPSTGMSNLAQICCVGTEYIWSVPCASILPPPHICIVIKHVLESYCCCNPLANLWIVATSSPPMCC